MSHDLPSHHSVESFLLGLKDHTDRLLKHNQKLQAFLTWMQVKSSVISAEHTQSSAAIRSFYFNLVCKLDRAYQLARALDSTFDSDYTLAQENDHATVTPKFDLRHDYRLGLSLALNSPDNRLSLSELKLDLLLIFAIELAERHDLALPLTLNRALKFTSDLMLRQKLQEHTKNLPPTGNPSYYIQWLEREKQAWVEQFRAVIITHRNIGHCWQFSEDQKTLLRQYYKANCTIVACLNGECDTSPEVQQVIKNTLLLPTSVIGNNKA